MDPLATSHFSHRELLLDFDTRVARDHTSFAILLTRIAEIDQRGLYLAEGYPSMKAFLVRRMKLPTENAAYKRLTAARVVRKYPGVLVAVSDGRLHLRGVLTLAPHLTPANADELVEAAVDKTCFELEVMLAQRFPRPDLPERLDAVAAPIMSPPADPLAPGRVEATIPDRSATGQVEAPSNPANQLAPERVQSPGPSQRVVPLAPERFGLQVTIDQETHDLLQQAQDLMSHQMPAGGIAPVLKRALKLLVEHLEKRKFAATDRPGQPRPVTSARTIPAAVKRAVWERDRGRCTFVSDGGRRCSARRMLEFDHSEAVAREGESTVENLRLRCRAHNQYEAERTFGSEFMSDKRAEARARAVALKQLKARMRLKAQASAAG